MMREITSAQNQSFKDALRLKTSRGRKTQQRVIIFGLREVQRAIAAGVKPVEIFLCSEVVDPLELSTLQQSLPDTSQLFDLPEKLMEQLKYGERIDGVVAISERPNLALDQLEVAGNALVVILESIEKPGNIGAALRSIDGAGADALILADPQCDAMHPNCIRASMGSTFTIPMAIASSVEAVQWCRDRNISILAAADSAETPYTNADMTGPTAIVLGSEANGLSPLWIANQGENRDAISGISIPMHGISDSLNVSVAAGVILFEALRQRQETGATR